MIAANWLKSEKNVARYVILLGAIAGMLLNSGCRGRTYVASFGDSPDGKYLLYVKALGAPGAAYVDRTMKDVWIIIQQRTPKVTLFQTNCSFTAEQLEWVIQWKDDFNASVRFHNKG